MTSQDCRPPKSRPLWTIALLAWLVILSLSARSMASVYTVSDGTFSPANWSQFFSSTAPGTTAGFSQALSLGNPGSYGRIDLNIPSAGNSYLMTFYTGASYSPASQGPIDSITFSADFRAITGGDIFFGFKQGSSYYFMLPPPFTGINNSSWSHVSYSANSASAFGDIFTYARPDFSAGPPLQFGIFMGYTTTGPTGLFSIGMDNFQATVTPVPEPGVATIVFIGLGALAFRSRCRKTPMSAESR